MEEAKNTPAETDSAARSLSLGRALAVGGTVLLYGAAGVVFLATLASVLLKVYLGFAVSDAGFAARLVFQSWRTAACVAGATVFFTLGFWLWQLSARVGWLRVIARIGLLVLPVVLALVAWERFALEEEARVANRYGFYATDPHKINLNLGDDSRGGEPRFPRANSDGFRDKEWETAKPPGVSRVLLVGDSFGYGWGVPEYEDTLHVQLEQALNHSGDGRWEVLNASSGPAGLWYYVEALLAIGRDVQPDVMVMSFLRGLDASLVDMQRVQTGRPAWLLHIMEALGVLNEASFVAQAQVSSRAGDLGDLREEMAAEFTRLVSFCSSNRLRLLVWLPLGMDPLFESFQEDAWLRFLVAEMEGGEARWTQDPTLAIPNDGHPTGKANRLFAARIAGQILEMVGGR